MAELLDHLRELNKESEQASHTSTDSSPMLSKKAKVSLFTVAASLLGSVKSSLAAIISTVAKPTSLSASGELARYASFLNKITPVGNVPEKLRALGGGINADGRYFLPLKNGVFVGTKEELDAFLNVKSNASLLATTPTSSTPTGAGVVSDGGTSNGISNLLSNPYQLQSGMQQFGQIKNAIVNKDPLSMFGMGNNSPKPTTPPPTGTVVRAANPGTSAAPSTNLNNTPTVSAADAANINPAPAPRPVSTPAPATTTITNSPGVPELFGGSRLPDAFSKAPVLPNLDSIPAPKLVVPSTNYSLLKAPDINFNMGPTPLSPEELANLKYVPGSTGKNIPPVRYDVDANGNLVSASKPGVLSSTKEKLGNIFSKNNLKVAGAAAGAVMSGYGLYQSAKNFDAKNIGSYLGMAMSGVGMYLSLTTTLFVNAAGNSVSLLSLIGISGPAAPWVAAGIAIGIAVIGLLNKFMGTKEREMNQEGKDLASLADSLEASSAPTTLAIASGVALNGLVIGYDTSSTANIPKRQIFSEAYSSNIISTRLGAMTLTDASGNALSSTDPENTVYVNKNRTAVSIVSKNSNGQREIITEGVSGDAPVTSSIAPEDNYIEAMTGVTAPQRNGKVTVTNRINPEFERSVRLQRRIADAAAGAAASDPVLANNLLRTSRNTGKLLDNNK